MATADGTLPADSHIGRVALSVGDLDRQVGFYRDVIGLHVVDRAGDTARLGTKAETVLELVDRPELPERGRAETGLFHTAIRVPSRDALGSALDRIQADWGLTGASDHLVSEALYLDDPEGNGVEVYCDRPMSAWPLDDDGRVGMETRPLDLADLRAESDGTDAVPSGTSVGHVHLEVSDIDATREFYTAGLGMRLRQTYGSDAVFLAAGDYHHHVGANVWNGRTDPAAGRGLDSFEVRVPDESALDGVRNRFGSMGRQPVDRESGFDIEDPDGIEIHVRVDEAGADS